MLNMLFNLKSSSTLGLIGMGGPWEAGILAIIVLVLFGNRLPGAAKSLGQSFTAFKKGVKEGVEDEPDRVDDKV